ncbi:2Fe-2S iron-sulfur cluster-binding protein [Phreatobacter cathodiphilus]|uniref:Ferredoxin n=1 Tax=Phreatobacter cathodiphilus TaxID=1868589 RepID=A0A2S0NF19_9HYPH|nr:2Fe-2S iron-sulfur cluster-binding protein [Phreatobacter cathodiphilus]AVO46738.1 ferredoxin [Phreatobacter cathodiphilus]
MPRITVLQPGGRRVEIEAAAGISLMLAAVRAQVPGVLGECGGSLACATCHVYVDPVFAGRLPPVTAAEDEMLDATASERRPSSRLSCQIVLTDALDGLVVTVPDSQI